MGFALLELIDKSHLAGSVLIWQWNIMPAEEAGEMRTCILPCHTAWKFHLHNTQYDITCIRLPIRFVELLFAFLVVKRPLVWSKQLRNMGLIIFHNVKVISPWLWY